MKSRGIKELLKIRGLKVTATKKELVAALFAASENGVQPVKRVVEIESDLITHYKIKLKTDDFPIPDPFKIPHGWHRKKLTNLIIWEMLEFSHQFPIA